MPRNLLKRWHGMHGIAWAAALVLIAAALMAYNLALGIAGLVLAAGCGFYTYLAERAFRREFKNYLGTMSYRIKKSGARSSTSCLWALFFSMMSASWNGIIRS